MAMKTVPLNDLTRRSSEEIDLLVTSTRKVIESGVFLNGENLRDLSQSLSAMHAGRSVVCVGNGTDALYIALRAAGVGPGTTVATVPNAGGYSTGAALLLGARVVLIDIDLGTGQMCPDSLVAALENLSVDVVVVTHLYGLAADIKKLSAMCEEYKVSLIEDCAQSIGCFAGDQPVGTFGDMATFSFYPTKNLGAFGDAGAIVCATQDLASSASKIAQYGWSERYLRAMPGGVNSRMDEIQAAFLNHRLHSLRTENERRRHIVRRYQASLTGSRRFLCRDDDTYVAHLAVMATESREIDAHLLAQRGISTGIHYPILDQEQPAWVSVLEDAATPNARILSGQILTLPCFPGMYEEEIDAVVAALGSLPV